MSKSGGRQRTTLANMLQRAKLTATIPDGGSRQLIWPTATTGSRGEKGTNTNRTSFRARSSPSTGRSPIASLEVTGMETIQCRITTRRCDGASTKHAKGHEPCAANNHLDHDDHHRSSSTCDQYQHEPISTQHQKPNHENGAKHSKHTRANRHECTKSKSGADANAQECQPIAKRISNDSKCMPLPSKAALSQTEARRRRRHALDSTNGCTR